ncbi:MAG: hypothetical protein KF784_09825 [Fimbriimonadaceae bacterium]|nr:hypothetical protein [Fimbriimonadaceae bacterium]
MSEPTPLYYTFGNHMHWVDMEWLWGYHVLPGSVRDMLLFCKETGARGNVNFDGIGYEKLASENPEAFQELREAIRSGQVEVVGGSYGQPYGLFHGGESNVRQRIYGVRACLRLFGVRPKTFWEEEFDFFPQLPQMLKGCGFEYSSLFFQWTWHTPEVPKEPVSAVWWEGVDGSRLLCAPRNELNLHQWPEDMQILLDQLSRGESPVSGIDDVPPLILQWLELMPSPDWMCRSEVLLPKMRELMSDPRFEVKVATLGEYLALHKGKDLPVRQYGMGDVWHGLSLGKNGDYMRELSASTERSLVQAESLASMAGLLGRPYVQWDVYPTWELEEGWRELLSAQHHDNDECEGLCGRVGVASYKRAALLAERTIDRHVSSLAEDVSGPADSAVVFNSLGWAQTAWIVHREGAWTMVNVPAHGYALVTPDMPDFEKGKWTLGFGRATYDYKGLVFEVEFETLRIVRLARTGVGEIGSAEVPVMALPSHPGKTEIKKVHAERGLLAWRCVVEDGEYFEYMLTVDPVHEALSIEVRCSYLQLEKPGFQGALRSRFPALSGKRAQCDTAYAMAEAVPSVAGVRKYPKGDWMTSEQWFEKVDGAFSANSLVDFELGSGGLLVTHDRTRQWFWSDSGVPEMVVTLECPWDEATVRRDFVARFALQLHSPRTPVHSWKTAQEIWNPPIEEYKESEGDRLPPAFGSLALQAASTIVSAFYRETEDYSGIGLEAYAGKGMGYPYVLRLVEWNGEGDECELTVAGTVAKAFRTNLMGEVEEELEVEVIQGATPPSVPPRRGEGGPSASVRAETLTSTPAQGTLEATPPSVPSPQGERGPENEVVRHPFTGASSKLKFKMRPHEIATLYLDIVEGRKQPRDLDAKREVWATVHREK